MSDRGRGLRLQERQTERDRVCEAETEDRRREREGTYISSLICAAREGSDTAPGGRRRVTETDRVILCGTEPGPVFLSHSLSLTHFLSLTRKSNPKQIEIKKNILEFDSDR